MKTINEFKISKESNKPISVVTCYDYWSALIINDTDIDAVLVGDSAAMVMHGFDTTVNAEVEMMSYHLAAVKRGLTEKLLIADMPFLAHRKGDQYAIETVDKFVKLGANAVKIEGAGSNVATIKHIVDSGVPVMGHIGLTPQSVNSIGGYVLQGKNEETSNQLINDAKALEDAGCFSIVLELIPAQLAKEITESIRIPTIGIGAGSYTSGQVLVLHDLLGLSKSFNPKFLRKYLNGYELIKDALNRYDQEVKLKTFPGEKESY
ncbi:MAG: 3-methyl-2-oxobutanoate hydroxymethyltransferase [Ignavibacteriaceae bacterium]|nr:3-methyl-2-oxobutanoate hydroxymethyltransferase [Ignavibacteriaceae bacterium]